jgi:hypothetical protein
MKSRKETACARFDPIRIAEYRDGAMSAIKVSSFERHLADCRTCREALRGLNEDVFRFRKAKIIRTSAQNETTVRLFPDGMSVRKAPSVAPFRNIYAAEAAGRGNYHPCKIGFTLDSGTAVLTHKNAKSAELSVRLKTGTVKVFHDGWIVAQADRNVMVLLERKGRYDVRRSGRILLSIKLS